MRPCLSTRPPGLSGSGAGRNRVSHGSTLPYFDSGPLRRAPIRRCPSPVSLLICDERNEKLNSERAKKIANEKERARIAAVVLVERYSGFIGLRNDELGDQLMECNQAEE